MTLSDINLNTIEGRLLLTAIVMIHEGVDYQNIKPDEIINIIKAVADSIDEK